MSETFNGTLLKVLLHLKHNDTLLRCLKHNDTKQQRYWCQQYLTNKLLWYMCHPQNNTSARFGTHSLWSKRHDDYLLSTLLQGLEHTHSSLKDMMIIFSQHLCKVWNTTVLVYHHDYLLLAFMQLQERYCLLWFWYQKGSLSCRWPSDTEHNAFSSCKEKNKVNYFLNQIKS